jgi:hypothetical protein
LLRPRGLRTKLTPFTNYAMRVLLYLDARPGQPGVLQDAPSAFLAALDHYALADLTTRRQE